MCGIAGFFNPRSTRNANELSAIVRSMTDAVEHRGPDDAGAWVDAQHGIGLGHRRLSILDLSPEGHQPMHSADGRFVIVFNGEIYNFQELGAELAERGHIFRGHSDTEIMLAAFLEWGIEESVKKFNGMFAFAVWDRQEQALHLGRDRIGEKPLYYGWVNGTLFFASELKSLLRHPDFTGEIDRAAITGLMRYNFIPEPFSIYRNIRKLKPSTLLSWNGGDEQPQPVHYWSLRDAITRGTRNPITSGDTEAVNELEALLSRAVGMRMVSDVPLGAFLSGGIDSTLIVALMQAQSNRPVRTFTIGFHEKEYDEARHASEVARHLGTDHTEMYVTSQDALAVIPRLPALYDEPFADYSEIPTYLVSALARRHVTVSLSGDAGDELFGGYGCYAIGRAIHDKFHRLPPSVRRLAASLLTLLPPAAGNAAARMIRPLLPAKFRDAPLGDKLHKLAEILRSPGMETLYLNLVSYWKKPLDVVIGGEEVPTAVTDMNGWPEVPDFTHRMMQLDMETYLPGDILVKVDRASMGASLESRVPFLDTDVIEHAWRIPCSMKVRQGQGKWILRQILYKHVPQHLIDRPKQGFGVPLDHWLRGELRDWAEALLDESRLRAEGWFRPEPIRQKWTEHLSGTRNWHFYLWSVLMFQSWMESHKNVRLEPSKIPSIQASSGSPTTPQGQQEIHTALAL